MADLFIYGRHPVMEALRADAPVRRLLLDERQKIRGALVNLLDEAERRAIPVERLGRGRLERLLDDGANHQGVAAALPPFRYASLDDLLDRAATRGEPALLLLLDGIQDVHNLGALLRSAEAVGAHGAVIAEHRAAGITGTVYRTSAGALHHLPVARVTNLVQSMERLKEAGLWIAGLEMEGAEPYDGVRLTGPIAIVVGAEGRGLGRLVAARCDFLVHLPMRGQVGSLNASVAGAVLLYEVLRQRRAAAAAP